MTVSPISDAGFMPSSSFVSPIDDKSKKQPLSPVPSSPPPLNISADLKNQKTSFKEYIVDNMAAWQRSRLQIGEVITLSEKADSLSSELFQSFHQSVIPVVEQTLNTIPIVGDSISCAFGFIGALGYLFRYLANEHKIDQNKGRIYRLNQQIQGIKYEIQDMEDAIPYKEELIYEEKKVKSSVPAKENTVHEQKEEKKSTGSIDSEQRIGGEFGSVHSSSSLLQSNSREETKQLATPVETKNLIARKKEREEEKLKDLRFECLLKQIELENQISQTKNDQLWTGLNIVTGMISIGLIVAFGSYGFFAIVTLRALKPIVSKMLSSLLGLSSKTITTAGYGNWGGWGDRKREETRENKILSHIREFEEYKDSVDAHKEIVKGNLLGKQPGDEKLESMTKQYNIKKCFHYRLNNTNKTLKYDRIHVDPIKQLSDIKTRKGLESAKKTISTYRRDVEVAYQLNRYTVTNKINKKLENGKKLICYGAVINAIALLIAFVPLVNVLSVPLLIFSNCMMAIGSYNVYRARKAGFIVNTELDQDYKAQVTDAENQKKGLEEIEKELLEKEKKENVPFITDSSPSLTGSISPSSPLRAIEQSPFTPTTPISPNSADNKHSQKIISPGLSRYSCAFFNTTKLPGPLQRERSYSDLTHLTPVVSERLLTSAAQRRYGK